MGTQHELFLVISFQNLYIHQHQILIVYIIIFLITPHYSFLILFAGPSCCSSDAARRFQGESGIFPLHLTPAISPARFGIHVSTAPADEAISTPAAASAADTAPSPPSAAAAAQPLLLVSASAAASSSPTAFPSTSAPLPSHQHDDDDDADAAADNVDEPNNFSDDDDDDDAQ